MRTIIAGSRTATKTNVYDALKQCEWTKDITKVISGRARGADQEGEHWASENNISIEFYPADWNTHGKKAGYLRNAQMAEVADALIAVWDGSSRGTKHMIDLAEAKGIKVFIFKFQNS